MIYCSNLPLLPEKHPNDSFDYFTFVLPSGLKVLHVRHAELEINLATLDVNVGYLGRNIEKFGIAHLLEHVLCRTTVKDGAHNVDLKNLIKGTSGEFEAHTYPTHTNYYFHCQPSEFYNGFKHFANIFNTTSIQSSIIDQEIESVNNEFDMRINEPMIKMFIILRNILPKNHLFHSMFAGNKKSLQNITGEMMEQFFKVNYTPDRMTLIVVSEKGHDEIKEVIEEYFAIISAGQSEVSAETKKSPANELIDNIVPDANLINSQSAENFSSVLGTISFVKSSVKGSSTLVLNWIISMQYDRLSDIGIYFKLLIENSLQNSLFHLLEKEGLITKLNVFCQDWSGYFWFGVEITLTSMGGRDYKKVLNKFFSYLEFLKEQPVNIELLKDELKIRKNEFITNYQTISKVRTQELAAQMHWCPMEHLLLAELKFLISAEDIDEKIKEFMNYFKPSNVIVVLDGDVKPNEKMKNCEFCELQYYTKKLKIKRDKSNFKLPTKNEFIPSDFDLKVPPHLVGVLEIAPQCLIHNLLWFAPINHFSAPKNKISLLLERNNFFFQSIGSHSLIFSLLNYFQQNYRSQFYNFYKSGFKGTIEASKFGLEFEFVGHADKLSEFAIFYIEEFIKFIRSNKVQLRVVKQVLTRTEKIDTDSLMKPVHYILNKLKVIPHSKENIWNYLEGVTVEKVKKFIKSFLTPCYQIKILVTGNFYEKEVWNIYLKIYDKLNRFIGPPEHTFTSNSYNGALILKKRKIFRKCFKNNLMQNSVLLFFQIPLLTSDDGIVDKKIIFFSKLYKKIFEQMFDQFFNSNQIAYNYIMSLVRGTQFVGIGMFVETKNYSCEEIETKLIEFVKLTLDASKVEQSFKERFNAAKRGMFFEYSKQNPLTLNYHSTHWNKIIGKELEELSGIEICNFLSLVEPDEFVSFIEKYLQIGSTERRIILVWNKGSK